jgi:CSLREA domain-containing protein
LEDRIAPAVLTVTSAADTPEAGMLTLREAVALANADANQGQSDTIVFDDGLGNATITLTAGQSHDMWSAPWTQLGDVK